MLRSSKNVHANEGNGPGHAQGGCPQGAMSPF